MIPDWLLVETLGDQPDVVAQGRQMKNFVPLMTFLRRNPNLKAIQAAIADTVAGRTGLVRPTERGDRVIRTEPVVMTDGCVHAVHVWVGPADCDPPERPIPGPAKWDLTLRIPFPSVESLVNIGMDPSVDPSQFERLPEVFPAQELNPASAQVLSTMVKPEVGRTYSTTWEFTDVQGKFRRLGVVGRNVLEMTEDGTEHLFGRGVDLVVEVLDSQPDRGDFAKRIIDSFAQPGAYRCFMDLNTLTLLKWLDEPCPLFNWRQPTPIHPDDEGAGLDLLDQLKDGTASGVLRLPGNGGGWVPMHVTVSRFEVEPGVFAGLATLRLATADEVRDVGLAP